jgi:hypothetical protein
MPTQNTYIKTKKIILYNVRVDDVNTDNELEIFISEMQDLVYLLYKNYPIPCCPFIKLHIQISHTDINQSYKLYLISRINVKHVICGT